MKYRINVHIEPMTDDETSLGGGWFYPTHRVPIQRKDAIAMCVVDMLRDVEAPEIPTIENIVFALQAGE